MGFTYETWDETAVLSRNQSFNDALDGLKWAYEQYGEGIVYACSFGAEGIVLLDLISKINRTAKVVFLDTSLHFKETYELIEKIKKRYLDMQIDFLTSSVTLEEQAEKYGEALWEKEPNVCCTLRKVEPLKRTLMKYNAWISGLRREQSETRKHVQFLNKDDNFKNVKVCPLIHWTKEEIWQYIQLHRLDYNPLHDQGYPSIGCFPCTQKATNPNDERSGRWNGFQKTECGLHSAT